MRYYLNFSLVPMFIISVLLLTFWSSIIRCIYVCNYCALMSYSFHHYKKALYLNINLPDTNITSPAAFWVLFKWHIFCPFNSNLILSFNLKYTIYILHVVRLVFNRICLSLLVYSFPLKDMIMKELQTQVYITFYLFTLSPWLVFVVFVFQLVLMSDVFLAWNIKANGLAMISLLYLFVCLF